MGPFSETPGRRVCGFPMGAYKNRGLCFRIPYGVLLYIGGIKGGPVLLEPPCGFGFKASGCRKGLG